MSGSAHSFEPLGHHFHIGEVRAVRRQYVCCPAKVSLWQLEGILWLPPWMNPWSQREASTAALAQKFIKAILGWMGSMVMIAWSGQLTQCCFLEFYFPCHLALYHTITQMGKGGGREISYFQLSNQWWQHLLHFNRNCASQNPPK